MQTPSSSMMLVLLLLVMHCSLLLLLPLLSADEHQRETSVLTFLSGVCAVSSQHLSCVVARSLARSRLHS